MLKIKLARFGKRGQPHYRIVVNEARDKRDGSYVESLGQYAPTQNPKILQLDVAKYDAWVAKGATPTDTVKSLAARFKSGNPFPPKPAKLSKKVKAKQAAAAEAAAAEAAAPAETAAATPEADTTPATATEAATEAAAPAETATPEVTPESAS